MRCDTLHGCSPPWRLLTTAACTNTSDDAADLLGADGSDDVLFLTQSTKPTAVMDALFRGRVVVDEAGCLRLDGPDPATVVWPLGFTLADGRVVRDGDGREVGRIGGRFGLGGGEVPTLHDGLSIPADVRQLAASRCPGRYWIVGNIHR